MADERNYTHIQVEPAEEERVIHVSASGVTEGDEILRSAQDEMGAPQTDTGAPQDDAPIENEDPSVQREESFDANEQETPDVPMPKMRIGVLLAVAVLVIVFVVWFAGMRMGLV